MYRLFDFFNSKIILVVIVLGILSCSAKAEDKMSDKTVYDFKLKDIDGKELSLSIYKGKVLLFVNVASFCGYTKQYSGLQKLYDTYKQDGLVVLGFPCNQFGEQEPGNEAEIKAFCETNYKVDFPLFSKIDVNGDNAHPLYLYLRSIDMSFLGPVPIGWNFTKFLVGRDGKVIKKFGSKDTPESIEAQIREQLKN
jgi:glutathione peroxidase